MYGTRTDGTLLPPALSIILHQLDENANFCCIIFKGIAKLVPKRRVWKPDGPLPLPFINDSWMKTPPHTNGKLLEIPTNNTISKEIKENTYKLVSSDTCIITYMTSFDATKTRIIEQKCIVNESKITPTWTIHNTFTNTKLKLCHYKRFRTFYNILFVVTDSSFDKMVADRLFCFGCQLIRNPVLLQVNSLICSVSLSYADQRRTCEWDSHRTAEFVETWNTPYVIFSLHYYFARKIFANKSNFLIVMNWK